MKICLIQPYYSFDYSDTEKCFNETIKPIDLCDTSMDLIVLPEYCDIPANTDNADRFINSIEKYNDIIYKKVVDTAKRCNAIVFANFGYKTENGYRNTTYVFGRNGEEVGKLIGAIPEFIPFLDPGMQMPIIKQSPPLEPRENLDSERGLFYLKK